MVLNTIKSYNSWKEQETVTFIWRTNIINWRRATDNPNVWLTDNNYKIAMKNIFKIRAKIDLMDEDREFQQMNEITNSNKRGILKYLKLGRYWMGLISL